MADDQKKPNKFGLGLILGAIAGGVAALFLTPTTGEENRELVAKKIKEIEKLLEEEHLDRKVKEIFGEVTTEAKELYVKAKKELVKKLAALKETVASIDREKYEEAVKETINILKKEVKREAKDMEKLKDELMKEWKKLEPSRKK